MENRPYNIPSNNNLFEPNYSYNVLSNGQIWSMQTGVSVPNTPINHIPPSLYGYYSQAFSNNPQSFQYAPPPVRVEESTINRENQRKAVEDYIISLLRPNSSVQSDIGNEVTTTDENATNVQKKQLVIPVIEPHSGTKIKRNLPKVVRKLLGLPPPSNYGAVDQQIFDIVQSLQPTEEDDITRQQLLIKLEGIVQEQWPDITSPALHLFGSSANNFGFKYADCDVCLIIDLDTYGNEKKIIQKLGEILRKKEMKNVKTLPRARVPIVKFTDPNTNISCDICLNNKLALQNTKLMATYAKLDKRVQTIGYIVKYWAKRRQINEPYSGSLSSYAYLLMVINYLQTRNPPVLPCLQQIYDTEQRNPILIDDFDCYFYTEFEQLTYYGQNNTETVGQLLIGFYKYYACEFDWDNSVVSIRVGRHLTKVEKQWNEKDPENRDNFLIAIEDPFELSHNLGRLVDLENLDIIKYEFQRAYKLLCTNESLITICKRYKQSEIKITI